MRPHGARYRRCSISETRAGPPAQLNQTHQRWVQSILNLGARRRLRTDRSRLGWYTAHERMVPKACAGWAKERDTLSLRACGYQESFKLSMPQWQRAGQLQRTVVTSRLMQTTFQELHVGLPATANKAQRRKILMYADRCLTSNTYLTVTPLVSL